MGGLRIVQVVNVGNNKGVLFVVHGGSNVLHGVVGADRPSELGVTESCIGRARFRGFGKYAETVMNGGGGLRSEGGESLKGRNEIKSSGKHAGLRNTGGRAPGGE